MDRPDVSADPALLAHYAMSARLHAERAAVLASGIAARDAGLATMRASKSWRLTAPLRALTLILSGRSPLPSGSRLLRALNILRRDGIAGLRQLRRRPKPAALAALPSPTGVAALTPLVVIIAELSVPQCAKYRVWQKQEMIERLGFACRVTDWRDHGASQSALTLACFVIFYRVPAERSVLRLIGEARALGLAPFWEVDDLIFDQAQYAENHNLTTLAPSLRQELLRGATLYREAMLACGAAIASTTGLAAAMRAAGVARVAVVQNALDRETLMLAETIRAALPARDVGRVVIAYGSGTKTHDIDFTEAAGGIARAMAGDSRISLLLVGELALPPVLDRFEDRIERLPRLTYRGWLEVLARADIAIAPLEDTVFNDAKSNIKFVEAAILGLPTIASRRAAFREAIEDGVSGLLADGDGEWEAAIMRLAADPGLRLRMGEAGRAFVRRFYDPDAVAQRQIGPLLGELPTPARRRLRVLMANVFFAPRSFGGATIVAEELARRLHAREDTEMFVFTSQDEPGDPPQTLRRYVIDGMTVIGMKLPEPDSILWFDNPRAELRFGEVLDAVLPDIVHLHSVQGLSASLALACQARGVPYVITLHDAWWLCERQFMVQENGRYCFQTRIDLAMCRECVPWSAHVDERFAILTGILAKAAHLLAPSAFHRSLYVANDIDPAHISVNRNGVRLPSRLRRPPAPGGALRFGFVGGNEVVKGFGLIRQAFEQLARGDWRLLLVDNTLRLGFSSIDTRAWRVLGEIETVPAYSQDELDDFFERFDVLLFPSQWKESFGLTVREALLRDVWVVVTEGGGASEDVVDGVNGTLIPLDGRWQGLAAAIERLLARPDRLVGYVNPEKARIAAFDEQAVALRAVLLGCVHP